MYWFINNILIIITINEENSFNWFIHIAFKTIPTIVTSST